MRRIALALAAWAGTLSCVSGGKVRADAEVIRADVERARRSGAMQCAPRELAIAEANLEFALGELSEGSSFRAGEHIHEAESAVKSALALSVQCGPKQVLIKDTTRRIVQIEEVDSDGDGIPDSVDKCPHDPEDKDGFQDEDGCPEPDNDHDGVPDVVDRCPMTPGPASNQGCPLVAAADRDGDGIADDVDRCPDQPEDYDGYQDSDGCPEADNDGDGVLDAVDRCPNMPGPAANYGCPIQDRDGDGIPDNVDKCPDEPEDKDGFQDQDGCPDLDNDNDGVPDLQDRCPNMPGPLENQGCPAVYKRVIVTRERIQITQQIKFQTNKSEIVGRDSFEILDEVAQAMRDNPQIKRIRIEGHTDSVGDDVYNLQLSERRADEVMAQLLKRGIEPDRMEAVGFGKTRPIASNATAAGRQENRRTEFNIVDQ
jgi:OOP family OmpA-OmpF porin